MRPETEAELAQMIRDARSPLSPVGGGTRLHPGEGGAARLDLRGLSGITLYEPAALTVVARVGTPLAELQSALAAEGQMLAFEPDARDGSTIGGVVAANASGARRVQSGACRDALLGVRFVDGQGQIIANGGRVMKNVTGYDLVKLMAGSRGQLGVLTEVALKTAPKPPVSVTLAVPGAATAAVGVLTQALTGPYDISGAAWLPGQGALVRVEGLEGSVAIRSKALAEKLGADPVACDWATVPRDVSGDLWRIICRPSEAPRLLAALPEPLALDWGGGLIWVALPPGRMPDLPAWSGHASRVSGDAALTLPALNPVVSRLNASLRERFDPRGIFASDGTCRQISRLSS